jgi:hypothetical protein
MHRQDTATALREGWRALPLTGRMYFVASVVSSLVGAVVCARTLVAA